MEKVEQKIGIQTQESSLEAFSNFIQQLNIFRRHLSTYPSDHPVLTYSADKVLQLHPELFRDTDKVQCAVVKKALFFEETQLDKKNKTFQDFAAALSSKGIIVLNFRKGLTHNELFDFCNFLNQSQEEIIEQGGIEQALKRKKFQYIQALKMNYNAFQVLEGTASHQDGKENQKEPDSLWEKFARSLLEDSTDLGGESVAGSIVDPVQLADFLNTQLKSSGESNSANTQKNLDFLLEKFEREGVDSYFYYAQAMENFGKFVENLSPQLRSQFLKGVFNNYGNRHTSVEKVLNRFSSKTILNILNDISSKNLAVSETVFTLLGNMSQSSALKSRDKKTRFNSQMENKLKTLFQEDLTEQFLNEDYQKTLEGLANHKIKATEEILKEISNPQEELSPHKVEIQLGHVVLELLNAATDLESQEEIKKNIFQSVNYFLETSDFSSIQKIHTRLIENQSKSEGNTADFYQDLLSCFEQPEFLNEVLPGLNSWGKEKLEEIRILIQSVGYSFVPALLDCLAEESKRTTRKFLLEQIYHVAPQGPIDPIISRLKDRRWFVVRNIVVILRTIGDPSALKNLEKLSTFPHPKVRFEIIKTFLHFQHPLGIKFLLDDLDNPDAEIRSNAIVLAEHCQAKGVKDKLLELLQKKGFKTIDLDTKKQIIKTLGVLSNPAVLPILKKLLSSYSLLNPSKNRELKKEITRSLSSYPEGAVKDIIRKIATSRNEELAEEAEDVGTKF